MTVTTLGKLIVEPSKCSQTVSIFKHLHQSLRSSRNVSSSQESKLLDLDAPGLKTLWGARFEVARDNHQNVASQNAACQNAVKDIFVNCFVL